MNADNPKNRKVDERRANARLQFEREHAKRHARNARRQQREAKRRGDLFRA